MRVLLIDNFDSFVYNLYQRLGGLGCDVDVFRNDEVSLGDAEGYDKIVISPGPGNPLNKRDFGICRDVISELGARIPILGVCLGHQGIISAFGGRIVRAQKPMHGKTSMVEHDGSGVFPGVKNPLRAMRYHSLVGEESSLPSCLQITARSGDDRAIMGVRHKEFPIFGVQFHPESIAAEDGDRILENFCRL